MSDFKYSKETINKIIKENNLSPVVMVGVKKDLEKIKPLIEEFYDNNIFYLDYWESECAYHGWSWAKDNKELENQSKITTGIRQKFLEIYALILAGLNEELSDE